MLSGGFGVQDFYRNFSNDPKVKIPWVRRDLSGPRVLTMEWIDGIRCTDPAAIRASGMDVAEFIRCGVVTGLRQLLEVTPPPLGACHMRPPFNLFLGPGGPSPCYALRKALVGLLQKFCNSFCSREKEKVLDAMHGECSGSC